MTHGNNACFERDLDMTQDRNALKIAAMIAQLETALEYAKQIQEEYAANGTDSLVNIDYGAALNTHMDIARMYFNDCDDLGLFTFGEA